MVFSPSLPPTTRTPRESCRVCSRRRPARLPQNRWHRADTAKKTESQAACAKPIMSRRDTPESLNLFLGAMLRLGAKDTAARETQRGTPRADQASSASGSTLFRYKPCANRWFATRASSFARRPRVTINAGAGDDWTRIKLAFAAFFTILFKGRVPLLQPAARVEAPSQPAVDTHDRAVQMLALLQREGRLIDFVLEDLTAYSDAQIEAAARDVHAGCHRVLERM